MKKNIISVILFILALVCYTIAFTSCGVITFTPYEDSVTKMNHVSDSIIAEFRATQKQDRENLMRYVNSSEYKEKYSGVSKANTLSNAKANSIVGTSSDPFNNIRTMTIGNPISTQYHSITFRYSP